MQKLLVSIIMLLASTAANADYFNDMYVKFGANYLASRSDNITATLPATSPIEGAVVFPPNTRKFNDWGFTYNIGFGKHFFMNNNWIVSPEIVYSYIDRQKGTINPFTNNPEFTVNKFTSIITGDLVSLNIDFAYNLKNNFSLYVTPGIGIARITTTNTLEAFAPQDFQLESLRSSERHNKVIPQLMAGVKYHYTNNWAIDLGLAYMYIGNLSVGKIAVIDDEAAATHLAVKNVYFWGPQLSFTYGIS